MDASKAISMLTAGKTLLGVCAGGDIVTSLCHTQLVIENWFKLAFTEVFAMFLKCKKERRNKL